MWVFDLDGTLIDSRKAVEAAYLHVGVIMPPWAWGKPWFEWLHSEHLHKRKISVYHKFFHLIKKMPLYDIVKERDYPVVTGASKDAVEDLCDQEMNVVACEMTRSAKIIYLKSLTRLSNASGVYVDDDPLTRECVIKETSWEAITPEEAYRRLSSQPEVTPA